MSKAITRPRLQDAVIEAATGVIKRAADGPSVTPGAAMAEARKVAAEVVSDPRVAAALTPVSWYKSHAIVGAVLAGSGSILAALPQLTPVVEELASPDQVRWWKAAVTVIGVLMAAVGTPVSVVGRVTTTRPIG